MTLVIKHGPVRLSPTLFAILAVLLGVSLCPGVALAQTQQNLSPAAPSNLTKPQFDTTTPLYDLAGRMEKSASTMVAEVDGRAITLGEVGDAIRDLPPSLGQLPFETLFPSVLNQLISQQALVIRAQHQALDEDPVVRRRVKAAADRTLANELLRREISAGITEKMLLDRYDRDIAGKPGPDEVHVRVIMTNTEAEAREIIAELQKGGDFGAIARRSSKDSTASVGGDLGFVHWDGLNPEVGAVAFALAPGQMAQYPVKSGSNWFIIKVEDRRPGGTPSFAVVREQLMQQLLREGVPGVVKAALDGVAVRQYTISGKEFETEPQQKD